MRDLIYKVFQPNEWAAFQRTKLYTGSADDQRDGFIHFSTKEQMLGTLTKHYKNASKVVVGKVRTENLKTGLKWEKSRGGALFPHLYGVLPLEKLSGHIALQQNHVGEFEFPIDF